MSPATIKNTTWRIRIWRCASGVWYLPLRIAQLLWLLWNPQAARCWRRWPTPCRGWNRGYCGLILWWCGFCARQQFDSESEIQPRQLPKHLETEASRYAVQPMRSTGQPLEKLWRLQKVTREGVHQWDHTLTDWIVAKSCTIAWCPCLVCWCTQSHGYINVCKQGTQSRGFSRSGPSGDWTVSGTWVSNSGNFKHLTWKWLPPKMDA